MRFASIACSALNWLKSISDMVDREFPDSENPSYYSKKDCKE